jgi:ribonucleoside-diphosphate reductase alpha chain
MRSDDTLKSIFATGQIMADYASKRAGIGLEIGRLRPVGAPIRDGEVMHTGIIPFLKKWYGDLRSCSQGGIRNASATITMPIWHLQFEDFIVLKNNKGTEETRVRHLDYAVMTSSMFWRRFKNKETITLFDPNQVPDLYEAFYSDLKKFEELYRHYEHQKGLRSRVVSAEDLFKSILVERTETGRIYIDFIDNVQRQTPFNTETHPIYQSNLCQEIFLPTKPFQTIDDENGRIALCTLSSINWGAFRHPDEMKRVCRLLVRGLHNLLQYQDFLSVHSYLSNLEFEPLGIGVTNLAYWHAKRRLKYGEAVALAEVKTWMEHQTFYLTQASMELAKEKGPCKLSSSTKYGQGIFPWECRAPGVDELTDFTPSSDLDWEGLRAGLRQYGIRNAVVSALPPVESSSVCINSTNGISMVKQMIVSKASKAGDFVQVVPEYKKLRHHYELLWSVPDCVNYLKTAAVLQAYVDQGISVDTFYSPRHFKNGKVDITLTAKNIMLAQKWGLKSLYYHLTEKQAALESVKEDIVSLVPVSSNLPASSQNSAEEDEDGCISCKL